jgi:hypothetical protein
VHKNGPGGRLVISLEGSFSIDEAIVDPIGRKIVVRQKKV